MCAWGCLSVAECFFLGFAEGVALAFPMREEADPELSFLMIEEEILVVLLGSHDW